MTSEAFRTWSQYLQLASVSEALIASLRSFRPIRHVSVRANNVTGHYPGPKLRMPIQFESEHVEFWAIYTMERDNDVLDFYEQSSGVFR